MTRLYDSLFASSLAVHVNGDNTAARPEHIAWRRDGAPGKNAWYTDSDLAHPHADAETTHIAWLLEPPELHPMPYEQAEAHNFDVVVSYSREHLDRALAQHRPWRFYAFGGTRIAPSDRRVDYEKNGTVSIVASAKRSMEGHRLRHELIAATQNLVAFGPDYNPIERKFSALAPFRFHVAIENARRDWWFTEALIDPLLTATVPIYWGCPDIGRFFDTRSIIQCTTLGDLVDAVGSVTPAQYKALRPHAEHNFRLAQEYVCTEDWLYAHYPELFDE